MLIRTIVAVCAAASLFAVAGCAAKNSASARFAVDTDSAVDTVRSRNDPFEATERYHLAQDHFIIARDLERQGEREAAWQYYEIAYEFWPTSGFLRKILVDKYMATEEYDRALTLFGDSSMLNGLTSEEKRTVGKIYLRLGDIARAAEAIEAIGGDKNEEDLYSLGLIYHSVGDKSKSLRNFREFFERSEFSVGDGVRLVQFNIGERKFADAESLAVVLRGVYPDNAEVVALLGTVRYLGGDTTSAMEFFGEALALDSLNEEALRTLAHIHVVRDKYPEAIGYYRRLMAQGGGVGAPYRRRLALLLFHIKDYKGAEKLIDTLILESGAENSKDLPGVHELHLYRGLIYSQTKRTEKAAGEFRAAIRLDSLNEDAWRELCYLYILAKNSDKAHDAVERYNAAFPGSGAGWRFRGYVLNMKEKYDDAVDALKRAVKIDSNDYFSWFEMGSILEKQKRINEAAVAFRNVLRIRPGDAQAANYLGYMWADADMMLDSAKLLIEIALEKDPKNGAYLDSYAWVFYRMGDYEKALLYINKAIEEMDDDPVPYEHKGDILFRMNDYRSAETAYKRSLKLKSEEAERIKVRLAEIKKIMDGKKGR